VDRDLPREGEGGVDCPSCERSDDAYIWCDPRWRLQPFPEPGGLPLVLILETRTHFAEPRDLPTDLAAELGVLIGRIDRAMGAIDGVGRVHTCRWGDGGEHLHWWFIARPARLPQLLGSFATIWDDILPPTPQPIWEANLAAFRAAFD
jgi:diadenosine tetraphosphate (Ap4A) HIT family hydrolase